MMMQSMQYEFRLFGGRKGKTMVINGHKFVHGVCRKVVTPVQAAPLIKVLAFYGAFAKGTPEYDKMLKAEQAEEAKANGADEVHPQAEQGSADGVHGEGEPDGTGPAAPEADDRSGAGDPASDGSGGDPVGDGHEDAGVPKFEESAGIPEPSEPQSVGDDAIAVAVKKLDPENDDHWVNTGAHKGKPKLSAVEEAYGKAGLTRQDLEAAIPGWTRDKALEAALED